ncbi:MAG: sigma-54-dependent Fis family transcriptional regulator, partial [Flavobacteriales bacterium]|nr:sigma-54-dependent Fis family transcriptional regulator [Flavobacteriales bacterium]
SINERELLYKVLFDMKNDLNDLKALVHGMMQEKPLDPALVRKVYDNELLLPGGETGTPPVRISMHEHHDDPQDVEHAEVEESLSLQDKEKELIRKALTKHRNRRKAAAQELGISERTLYRKIKEYGLN